MYDKTRKISEFMFLFVFEITMFPLKLKKNKFKLI